MNKLTPSEISLLNSKILSKTRNIDIVKEMNISNAVVCFYKKKLGIVKKASPKKITKRDARLQATGLTRDELTAAISKFIKKKENVKRTRHEFNINFEDIKWNKVCPILNIKLDYFTDKIQPNSVSFDRLDNSKGYVKGNVIIVSYRANMLKSDATLEELELLINFYKENMLS